MGMLARIGFAWVKWKSRYGLRDVAPAAEADRKQESLRVGVRGETYAYWNLRRRGYVFISKNYAPAREKGELDLVGFDGDTLAFVEVRTRAVAKGKIALPELSISREKHQVLVRTANAFLRERHVKKCPVRFDGVGIDNTPGKPPVERLHKDALGPRA
jgi:putative endonuclease